MTIAFRPAMMGVAIGMLVATTTSAETVVIAHFGDPTPMNTARAADKFEEATGWTIEWRKFAAGTDVIAAMASGDVKLAELGSSPLAIAASQGVDLQMFMYSFAIGDAESLIAHDGSGIETLADLKGKRVAVPIGSTAHYSLMGALEHAGIGEGDVTILGMPPDQIAAAWQQGALDAAFVWQPVQAQLLETGTRIAGAGDAAEWGYPTFNAWVVDRSFADENFDALVAFTRTMDQANAAYLDDPAVWTQDSQPVKDIARLTGAEPDQVPVILEGYNFIPLADQVGDKWLGGAAEAIRSTATFLKDAGRLGQLAGDYSGFVNMDVAKAAVE